MTSSPNDPLTNTSATSDGGDRNPYQSPATIETSADLDSADVSTGDVFRFGGSGVLGAALFIGAAVGVAVSYYFRNSATGFEVFVAPAIGWVVLLMIIGVMRRRSSKTALMRGLMMLPWAIPAYMVYVPVCSFGGMFTAQWMLHPGSPRAANIQPGIVISSAVAFVLVAAGLAGSVRAFVKRKQRRQYVRSDEALAKSDGVIS